MKFFALAFLFGTHAVTAQVIELPEGLGDLMSTSKVVEESDGLPFDLTGFIESRLGIRLQNDPHEKEISLGEVRLQIGLEKELEAVTFNLTADFIYDPVMDAYSVDLETGQGFIDIREANMTFSPVDFMDVKLGRQILTWGTGDMVFINDMFAKDWNSFFIGRDDEYLKAPSDALKMALFFDQVSLDIVYIPRFDGDRFIDGARVSFFDRGLNGLRGRENPVTANRPDGWFSDDELAMRAYRSFGAYEAALYYYNGFWKSPAGQDVLTGNATFPKLQVYGASLRGPLAKGIAAIEVGYNKSARGAASNLFVRNSEFRFLASYEQEIATELTATIQYYLERKLEYGAYLASQPNGAIIDDRNRHLFTLRLTKLLMQQNLIISAFNFYSPSDKDGYLRLNISYKISDNLEVEGGGNIFYGKWRYSFFSQFENNSNIYTGLRYSF